MLTAGGGVAGFTPEAFTVDHGAFLNDLAGGTFAIAMVGNDLRLVFTPAAPRDAASLRKCPIAIAKQSAAFAQAKLSALQRCRARIVAGKLAGLCPDEDPKAVRRIAAAFAKLQAGIAKACGGKNRTCNAGDTGVDADVSRTGTRFPARCSDLDPSCDTTIGDLGCADVGTCLGCVGGAAVDATIGFSYGVTPADPKAAKALNAGQQAIGKHAATLFTARSKVLRSCWTRVIDGKIAGPCPDPARAVPAIAKAEERFARAIAKACCGKNRSCHAADVGADADFDPVTDVGFPASCPDVTVPDGASCGGAVTDVQSLTSCLRCTTEHEVEAVLRRAHGLLGADRRGSARHRPSHLAADLPLGKPELGAQDAEPLRSGVRVHP